MPPPICTVPGDSEDIPEAELIAAFAGVSRLSGKVIPEARLASSDVGILRVAARAASRRDGWIVRPESIAVEKISLQQRLNIAIRIVLYILPTWLSVPIARMIVGNTLRALLPPRSVVLRHDPVRNPRVSEHLSLQVGGAGRVGQVIEASGLIEVVLEVDAEDTWKLLRRNPKMAEPIEAGYLLLPPTSKAVWSGFSSPVHGSSHCLRAISPLVLSVGDLRTDPELRELVEMDRRHAGEVTGVREIACKLPFQIPSLSADRHLAEMLAVSPGVSPDGDMDRLRIAVTVDPQIQRYRLGKLHLDHVGLRFADSYPPIRDIRVIQGQARARRRADAVSIPDTGSAATVELTDDLPLGPGESFIIEVQFHVERHQERGGVAELELQFTYDAPIGLPRYAVLTYPGGRAHTSLGIEKGQLTLHVQADVDLGRLKFRERVRVSYTMEAHPNYAISMAEILRLAAMLADEQIVVRHILQAPPPGYPDPGGFACDVYGRDETTLTGPDIQIRVLRDASATRADPSPVRFEVTVLGRTSLDRGDVDVKGVADAIRTRLHVLISGDGVSTNSPEMPFQPATAQATSAASDTGRATSFPVDRMEVLVGRFESGLERLSQLLQSSRVAGE